MYMNAITVNYAEVGDDHLPISFGFGSKTSFAGETVYNSTITEISDTSCIILQGRDIGTTDIIVSSSLAANRLLSGFNSGSTSWIKHIIPNISNKNTTYIFYKSSEGYYYKMVENDQGKPVQEKYAPYVYLKAVQNNVNYPYCEATIETPVSLNISNGKVNAIINSKSVQIAEMESSLIVELENADGSYNGQSIENEYTINTSTYNLDGIKWTRNNNTVTPWLSGNKIVKSSMSATGWTKTIKLLAGNNIVTIPRNKSTIRVNFTFTNTNMPSFEWGGAYYNGLENSTMSNNNTLTIKNVRQGSSINLTTFYTDSITNWFNPSSIIGPLPGSGTFNVNVSIPTPSVKDTIKFTGWIDGKLEQDYAIERPHDILPKTYTIDNMNIESLNSVDITNETTAISGLLTYDQTSKQFKRHRQITQINKSSTSTRTTTINDSRTPGTTNTDIYIYTSNNNVPQTFNVIAKYSNIPYIVNGDNKTGATNQVVSFKNTNYVYNDGMKQLVKNLTNADVTSLNGSKAVTYYDSSKPVNVQFPDITFSITVPSESEGGAVKETPSEGEVSPSSSTETTEEYTATINCIVKDFAVARSSYTIEKNNTYIEASLIYNINCKANNNGTSFTCTVIITKMTIQDKDYTISNATTSQTGNVQTDIKQLFS